VATALVLVCALALGALVLAARDSADGGAPVEVEGIGAGSPFAGAVIPPGVRAPDFALTDERDEPIRMRDLRGSPAIVTFLYTTCEETCPAAAQQVKGALDELGHDVPAVAVSVDPPRDTPASARRFNAKQRVVGRLRWALGERAELRPVWRGFAIQPQLPESEHQARMVLVDRRGFQRIGFPLSQVTPERLAHDVRLLERE
jgi:protein SCO1/2